MPHPRNTRNTPAACFSFGPCQTKHDQALDVLRQGLSLQQSGGDASLESSRLLLAMADVEADRSNWRQVLGLAADAARQAAQLRMACPVTAPCDEQTVDAGEVELAAEALAAKANLVQVCICLLLLSYPLPSVCCPCFPVCLLE